jgi:hypothetical protein
MFDLNYFQIRFSAQAPVRQSRSPCMMVGYPIAIEQPSQCKIAKAVYGFNAIPSEKQFYLTPLTVRQR